jgi:hypothetical protein
MTSITDPSRIPLHISQVLHGFPSMGFLQFTAREKILASVVFPVPLVQQKR